ncbi:hypothetical protein [Lichenicoccus sp.]|uniref:hypothetical protein n=1 Tax=Lichenicoccus sp. TaxID=2781899 RepID=UPI003D12CF10
MSDTRNVFGLLQPNGTSDPLAVLAGSPAYRGIAAVVSALYGPGRTTAQVTAQTVADPGKVTLNLLAGQVGEETYNDNASLGPFLSTPGSGLMLYDNTDVNDVEIVSPFPATGANVPDDVLDVLLGGAFEVVSEASHGAFIVAGPTKGGGPISHHSNIQMQPRDDVSGGYTVEDDVGITTTFIHGNNLLDENGTDFLVITGTPRGNPITTVTMTGTGSGGQIDIGANVVFTQTGRGNVTVQGSGGGIYIHTGSGAVSSQGDHSTVDMVHGDLTLNSQGGDVVSLGDGTSRINTAAFGLDSDTILAGSGAVTLNGGGASLSLNAVVFGGSGRLAVAGAGGVLVLGSGNATIDGGAARMDQEIFGGSGTILFKGAAEQADLIAGQGSVTIQAGGDGGWYSGGTNGDNSLTATGVGTVLVAGGNGDTLTGGASGWSYLVAGRGNETLVGGNQSGSTFFFGGSGREQLDLGSGLSVINSGAGAATINGGGGAAQLWLTASSGSALIDPGAGGTLLAVGFRLGTDHIHLGGQQVTAEIFAGGTSALHLSGGSTIELVGVDATKATNLFG